MRPGVVPDLPEAVVRQGLAWDLGAEEDADAPPTERTRPDRPYFEILIVEDMSEQQENALREELRRCRRPDDPFVYEIVVVPSFDDAIMAARLNFRLQACVVRRRFTHRSRYDSSSLAQFVVSIGPDDLMERSPDDRAQELARSMARIRPELNLYLMTEISVEDLAGRLSHHFRRIFHTREGSLELHLSILDGVAARYRAPFFSALKSYSHRPTGVFHALPVSHGKSIINSHWIRDMVDFLRPGYLPGRDVGDLRRARLAAGAHRPAARGAGTRGPDLRLEEDAPAAGAAAGRQAGPGQDAAADQLHLRRDRL